MDIKSNISRLWLVLVNYEKARLNVISEEDYLKYIERISIYFKGAEEEEIYLSLRGLKSLGLEIKHEVIRSVIFHMIDLVKGEENNGT